jgi:hypothetical protein
MESKMPIIFVFESESVPAWDCDLCCSGKSFGHKTLLLDRNQNRASRDLGQMSRTMKANIAVGMAMAMKCIHECDFFYQDLQPANI